LQPAVREALSGAGMMSLFALARRGQLDGLAALFLALRKAMRP
jgi:hypothetical protein